MSEEEIIEYDGEDPLFELAQNIIRVERKYFYADSSSYNRLSEMRELIDQSIKD
jgi:hypothetical protein